MEKSVSINGVGKKSFFAYEISIHKMNCFHAPKNKLKGGIKMGGYTAMLFIDWQELLMILIGWMFN